MKNILSISVSDLPAATYWKALAVSVSLAISSTILYSVSFDWNNDVYLYALGISGFFYIISLIILALRFEKQFELLIDAVVIFLTVGHLISIFSPTAELIYMSVPILGYLAFFIVVGGWKVFYIYVLYRVYTRYKTFMR